MAMSHMTNTLTHCHENLTGTAHGPSRSESPSIISQIEIAARNPLPAVIGALIGALVPSATFMVGHYELVSWTEPKSLIVLGGLVFSALTVFRWGRLAFGSAAKALGFVILAEGVMTFCSTAWLSIVALGYLVLINAIATGCTIALDAVRDRTAAASNADSPETPAPVPAMDMSAQVMTALTSLEAKLDTRDSLRLAAPNIKRTRKRSTRKPNTRQLRIVPDMSKVPAAANLLGSAVA
jgi:hypothetical protein